MRARLYWRSFRGIAGLLVTMALLVAACGGDGDDDTSGATGDQAAEAVDRSAHFRYGHNITWFTYDPHRVRSIAGGEPIWLGQVYERLLRVDRTESGEVELQPELATSFTVAEDGLSVEFELREGVMFHDGTPFNADAVKANIERAKGPDSTVASVLTTIESVEAKDDRHAVFHLSEPDPVLPFTLTIGNPGYMVSPAAFDTDLHENPVGTGPFTLVSFTPTGDHVFQRWDGYWDEDAILFEQLTLSTVTDANARFNGVRTGTFDAALVSAPQDAEAESLEPEGYRVWKWVGSLMGLSLNANLAPLDDVRVRRAISMAINRQEIFEQVTKVSPPTHQVFYEGTVGYDPSLEDPYDAEEARSLVREAGAEGATIRVIQQLSPPVDVVAEVLQQTLGDIGLNVELIPLASPQNRLEFNEGKHHVLMSYILTQIDPSLTLEDAYLGMGNPAGPPAELVEMANEAKVLPLGSEERSEAYQEISRYLYENPIHVPIAESVGVVVSRPNVIVLPDSAGELGLPLSDLNFRGVGIAS